MGKLGFVGRGKHLHVRNRAKQRHVEHAMMGGAVIAHQAGAVDGEYNIEVFERYVDDGLVYCSLEERGVQRHNGLLAAKRQTAGHADRMTLGDTHIEAPLGMTCSEFAQAGAVHHGSRNGADALIQSSLFRERLGKSLGVGKRLGLRLKRCPSSDVVRTHPMEARRLGFCRSITSTLLGNNVHKNRHVAFECVTDGAFQRRNVVPVHRRGAHNPQLLEQHGIGHNELL